MVAVVESAAPRRLLGFSFAGYHSEKEKQPSPPVANDPWRALYA